MDEFSFRLRPSAIAGVGVFSLHTIKKGAYLRLNGQGEKIRVFRKRNTLINCYCTRGNKFWYGPADFGRMSLSWYLNHSDKPNAEVRIKSPIKLASVYAIRRIRKNEEITINYDTINGNGTINGR